MKKLLSISLFLFAFIGCKQKATQFTINGTVETKIPLKEIFITNVLDTIAITKTKVVDGKFTLTGKVEKPMLVKLQLDTGEYRQMVLQNTNYTAVINDDFKYIKGGDYNEQLFGYTHSKEYLDATKELDKKSKKEYAGIAKGDLKALKIANENLNPYYKKVFEISKNHYSSLLENNTPTLVKLYALTLHYDWENYDFNRKIELLNEYEKELPNNELLLNYRKSIVEALENDKMRDKTKIGNTFIDFSATSIDGKKITLSEVVSKNKYTLVEFWASWCKPCRGSFPHLKEKYAAYKDKGLEVFGISLDTDKESYLLASKEEELPWINTADHKGFSSKAATEYAVRGIPYTILIGQDGKIIDSGDNIRGLALDDTLKKLYKE